MRSRFRSEQGPNASREGRSLELVRVRGTQRNAGHEGRDVRNRGRRRGTRGRSRGPRPGAPQSPQSPQQKSLWSWFLGLFAPPAPAPRPERPERAARSAQSLGEQEAKAIAEFSRHFGITFRDPDLLKLALTHRSYLSVSGQGASASNERLEFLGDSVLGLVTSEFLYRHNPNEHEGQLTKTKSLLVSKAILSRRALAMGLGRFVLMSHSEVESGGRQRLSIIADAFEGVVGAIYLDQGFEAARAFIERWLLRETKEITSDRRHTNYKSHLQEYVQSTFRTHPVYRIRSEMGPDHSKQFMVEVMVGRRTLGEGKGRNKKEAEQAAARDAIERVEKAEGRSRTERRDEPSDATDTAVMERPATPVVTADEDGDDADDAPRRRGRRGGRGRRSRSEEPAAAETSATPDVIAPRSAPPSRAVADEVERPAPARRASSAGIPVALPPEDGRFERLRQEVMGDDQQDVEVVEVEPAPMEIDEDDFEEIGRPEGPHEDRRVDVYAVESDEAPSSGRSWTAPREMAAFEEPRATRADRRAAPEIDDEPEFESPEAVIQADIPSSEELEDDVEVAPDTFAEAADEVETPEDDAPVLPPRFDPEVPAPPPVVREPVAPTYGRRSSRGRRGPGGR